MQLIINEKKENKLCDRIEIYGKLSFQEATPSSEQVRDSIASQMKVGKENIVVKSIYTAYGYPNADVTAFVYGSQESLTKFEPKLGKKALEKIEKKKTEEKETKKVVEEPAEKEDSKEEAKPEAVEEPAKKEDSKEEAKPEAVEEPAEKEEMPAEEPKDEKKEE